MFAPDRHIKSLHKRARLGFAGYPIATLALYGPNDAVATKLVVGIVLSEDADAEPLQRWFSEKGDIRNDATVMQQALQFVRAHGAKSVAMTDGVLGCPHEEGIDYPEGEPCPRCPFWAKRDRWGS